MVFKKTSGKFLLTVKYLFEDLTGYLDTYVIFNGLNNFLGKTLKRYIAP